MSKITLKNVSHAVNKEQILKNINLTLNGGEIIGIIGPNGAGKSTLLKIMSLLITPTKGEIYYDNLAITSNSLIKQMIKQTAFVMQKPLLFNMTVEENIAVGLKLRKCDNLQIKTSVSEWSDKLQISHLRKRSAYNLSGGEAKRVNLARALITNPKIIFLDEPFVALDYPTKIDLTRQLKEIFLEKKLLVLFTSHDLQEIKFLTNRLLVLVDGKIVQNDKTEIVLENPNHFASPFVNKLTDFLKN